jgi:pimeloyl-ACP methyl ester carboxylesterase
MWRVKAFLEIDGKPVFCPADGEGESVVLMHGGGANHESWHAQFPVLSQRYRVYVPDRPGHGRTADSDWDWTPDNVADHTARMLEMVDDGPYALVGWSDGAVIALRVALRHPSLVRKLVLIGSAFTRAGEPRAARAFIESELRGGAVFDGMKATYDRLSPDGPDHWAVVVRKLQALWDAPDELTIDDLAAIAVPTLVMQGDDDGVTFEHSAAVARTVQDGQLAVVPGTGHALPIEKPDIVNALLLDFLGEPPRRQRMFPLGSLHDL